MNIARTIPALSRSISLLSLSMLATPSFPAAAADRPAGIPDNYTLQYEQTFDSKAALKDLVFSDPKAWRFAKDGDNGSLELHGKSDYNPKDRSPFNIALVSGKVFGDFVLDLELQSTVKP